MFLARKPVNVITTQCDSFELGASLNGLSELVSLTLGSSIFNPSIRKLLSLSI